jgi:hypothetical protein
MENEQSVKSKLLGFRNLCIIWIKDIVVAGINIKVNTASLCCLWPRYKIKIKIYKYPAIQSPASCCIFMHSAADADNLLQIHAIYRFVFSNHITFIYRVSHTKLRQDLKTFNLKKTTRMDRYSLINNSYDRNMAMGYYPGFYISLRDAYLNA